MKKKRHTPEQIVRMLRQAEAKLAAGTTLPEVTRELGISEATFHRWRNRYGGIQTDSMGSGSTMGEKGEVVAVQKEPQTNLVHLLRLGKR